jgi:hypothetical protein
MKTRFLIICMLMTSLFLHASDLYSLKSSQKLMSEQNTNSQLLQELTMGDTLKLVSKLDGWDKVQTMKGTEGYIVSGSLSELTNPNEMPIGGKILLITLIVIVIGVILGFTKFVTIYRDYNDLALTFGIVAVLLISLPFSAQLGNAAYKYPVAPYISIGIDAILLLWMLIRAIKQNNVFAGVLAFIVKIPLVIVFLYYVFKMLSAERVKDKVSGGVKAGLLALLMNGLVKTKEWKSPK